jgi:hypothetical protein
VLARVAAIPSTDWELGPLLRGEPRPAVIASVRGSTFCLSNSFTVPHFHDVRAYGRVTAVDALRSSIVVELRRSTLSRWAVGSMWAMYLVLTGSMLLAATQDPVFIMFAAFVALFGGLLLWNARERSDDRERLRTFILRTFPESVGPDIQP